MYSHTYIYIYRTSSYTHTQLHRCPHTYLYPTERGEERESEGAGKEKGKGRQKIEVQKSIFLSASLYINSKSLVEG